MISSHSILIQGIQSYLLKQFHDKYSVFFYTILRIDFQLN